MPFEQVSTAVAPSKVRAFWSLQVPFHRIHAGNQLRLPNRSPRLSGPLLNPVREMITPILSAVGLERDGLPP